MSSPSWVCCKVSRTMVRWSFLLQYRNLFAAGLWNRSFLWLLCLYKFSENNEALGKHNFNSNSVNFNSSRNNCAQHSYKLLFLFVMSQLNIYTVFSRVNANAYRPSPIFHLSLFEAPYVIYRFSSLKVPKHGQLGI